MRIPSMCRKFLPRLIVALGLLVVGFAASDYANAASLSNEELKQRVELEFGVTVLELRDLTQNGTPIVAVKIMNPSSDNNAAFLVRVIAIDPETGKLVPQFRHGLHGASTAAPPVSVRIAPRTATSP